MSDKAIITAKVHPSVKKKLDESNYNSRHAIEYFVKKITNPWDSLNVEEEILNQEIDELKYLTIVKEKRLEDIQKEKAALINKQEMIMDKPRNEELKIESYHTVLSLYSEYTEVPTKDMLSFEDFAQTEGVIRNITGYLVDLDMPLDEYIEGLVKYRDEVILGGNTV